MKRKTQQSKSMFDSSYFVTSRMQVPFKATYDAIYYNFCHNLLHPQGHAVYGTRTLHRLYIS